MEFHPQPLPKSSVMSVYSLLHSLFSRAQREVVRWPFLPGLIRTVSGTAPEISYVNNFPSLEDCPLNFIVRESEQIDLLFLSGIWSTSTKETHFILTVWFNLTSLFLQLSLERVVDISYMFDSSKFSDHPHGARDNKHNDKLSSRSTISQLRHPPLFDSVGIKHTIKRPSHSKLKLANFCWKTSKSWQTLSITRQTRVK